MAHTPTREEHPLPALTMHWLHLVSILVLVFTGFYIHWPFFAGAMGIMRNTHFVFMFILVFATIARVYWAFFGAGSATSGDRKKIRDYRFFGPQPENSGQLWQTLKYYLFLRKTHPQSSKYNPLQKLTYMFWLLLIVLQAITGFALWTPTAGFFGPLTYALGGVSQMRVYHYLIMWLFIASTALHIYLSLAEMYLEFPLMFWWKEPPPEPERR